MQDSSEARASDIIELDLEQLDAVSGGSSAEWGVATGTAVALTVGAATVAAPVVAGAMAAGGILSAAAGIYYAIRS